MTFPIYLISKEAPNPRTDLAEARIVEAFGVKPIVIVGVDASTEGWRERCIAVREDCAERLAPGYVACSSAHSWALTHLLSTEEPAALILEDDAVILASKQEFELLISFLAAHNFDWCKCCHSAYQGGASWASDDDIDQPVRRASMCSWSNTGYFVSRSGAAYLLSHTSPQYTTYDCVTRMKAAERACWNITVPMVRSSGEKSFILPTREINATPASLVEDRILCINLDKHPERMARMERIFETYGIPGRRFPAVDGHTLPKTKKRPGELGCLASHVAAWEAVQRSGKRHLILEDDVIPCVRFRGWWHGKQPIPRADIIFLGVSWPKVKERADGWYDTVGCWGAFAYMITAKGAEQLLESAREHPTEPADYHTRYLHRRGLVSVLPKPSLMITQWAESSIAPRDPSPFRRYGNLFADAIDPEHYGGQKNWVECI